MLDAVATVGCQYVMSGVREPTRLGHQDQTLIGP
jgi:hypothetical protein